MRLQLLFPFSIPLGSHQQSLNHDDEPQKAAAAQQNVKTIVKMIDSTIMGHDTETIIMRTGSKYHWIIVLIVAFPICSMLVPLLWAIVEKDYEKAKSLIWGTIFVLTIFILVLPKGFDVRTNGVIGVETLLTTWKFANIERAYPAPVSTTDIFDPRFKFATTFNQPYRVLVRRRGHKWNVLVSPVDPEEFINAVNNLGSGQNEKLKDSITTTTTTTVT